VSSGRYRIIEKLGSGGMGEVFLAEDVSLRRQVALKKLAPSRLNDDSRRMLLHEARAIARVNHPHIAAIHDLIEEPDGSYLVMEYVPGMTLAARLKEGPLAPADVIRLSRQMADALAAAHEQGVIHRDLKPANIHLMPSGDIKILDFGLARTLHPAGADSSASTSTLSDPMTPVGAVVGTLPYIPPEALRGEPSDARGDIYSLGVTIFELLTGRLPYQADNRMAFLLAVTSRNPPHASEVNHAVPEQLSHIVDHAMARDPFERYQSAHEMLDDLNRIGSRRLPLRRILTTVATLAAVVIGTVIVVQKSRELTPAAALPRAVAVLPFLSIGPDSSAGYVAAGMTDIIGTNLAALPISVIPPGRAGRYRTPDRDLGVLTEELGASLVIDGSVQKYDDRLRITIKMLKRGSDKLDWTHTYDGEMASVITLQQEILAGLADGLTTTGMLDRAPAAPDRDRLVRAPTSNEEAFADYTQGRAFLERDDLPANITRAIALFESAFRKDPHFALALGGLGEAYWSEYRRTRDRIWADQARETAGRAVAMDSTNIGVRLSLAIILVGTGQSEDAARELARITADQPRHDKAHSMLGDVHERRGQQLEASREFREAIALRPAYWEYHWQLGRSSLKSGDLATAAAEARRVTELQPDNPLGHQLLGTILQTEGKTEEAVASYERSLALSPTASAFSNIGGTFFDGKDYPRAAGFYRRAIAIDPRLPVYQRNLGDALLEMGDRPGAMHSYAAAVTLADSLLTVNPRDANTTALKALCLAKMGRGEEALKAIEQAKSINSTSPNILYKGAVVLALLDQKAEALQALQVALDAGLPPSIAASDLDLRSISSSVEFKRLMSR